jgi:hypothetical protein
LHPIATSALIAFAACSSDAGYSDVRPVIERLPFTLRPYDATTMRAGALDFRDEVSGDKILIELGARLLDGTTGDVVSPQLLVRLRTNAFVFSPIDGVITSLERNLDSAAPIDYEIRLRAAAASRWEIGLDHVAQQGLRVGMSVQAGDILGGGVVEKRFEFDIYDLAEHGERWCPNVFMGDPRAEIEAELLQLFADWEAFKGNTAIYDEAAMFAPGCAVERLQL